MFLQDTQNNLFHNIQYNTCYYIPTKQQAQQIGLHCMHSQEHSALTHICVRTCSHGTWGTHAHRHIQTFTRTHAHTYPNTYSHTISDLAVYRLSMHVFLISVSVRVFYSCLSFHNACGLYLCFGVLVFSCLSFHNVCSLYLCFGVLVFSCLSFHNACGFVFVFRCVSV